MSNIRKRRSVLLNLFLVIISSFLFFLSHPNCIFPKGIGFLGFFELIPVFFLLKNSRPKYAWLYGFFYGALSYGLFCYWLAGFNPYTIYIGLPAFGIILAIVFESMNLFSKFFPDQNYYAMALVWLVYEYLKTKGFLAFPYGLVGYTQWNNPLLLQTVAFAGVWWVSSLCVFASAFVSGILESFFENRKKSSFFKNVVVGVKKNFALNVMFFTLLVFSVVYGALSLVKKENSTRLVKVVCVQNNADSNKYGFEVYKKDVASLKNLSEKALEENPSTDFVIWPETAVVPGIMYHYKKNIDKNRFGMVLDLMSFMSQHDSCFVIGNPSVVDNGKEFTDDYNSALVFDLQKGNINPPDPDVYYKIHLVPFTEYFPYEKLFPRLYKALLMGDTHLWTPGEEYVVFENRGLKFSTPICFEDTFGDLCRNFVKNGAQCLFNLTNDSWSKSVPCQTQHLSMSVFRAVENGVPVVRATASGATCFIDSKGKVQGPTDYFKKNYLAGEISVSDNCRPTFYNRFGDWLAYLEIAVLVVLFVWGIIKKNLKPSNNKSCLKDSGKME